MKGEEGRVRAHDRERYCTTGLEEIEPQDYVGSRRIARSALPIVARFCLTDE